MTTEEIRAEFEKRGVWVGKVNFLNPEDFEAGVEICPIPLEPAKFAFYVHARWRTMALEDCEDKIREVAERCRRKAACKHLMDLLTADLRKQDGKWPPTAEFVSAWLKAFCKEIEDYYEETRIADTQSKESFTAELDEEHEADDEDDDNPSQERIFQLVCKHWGNESAEEARRIADDLYNWAEVWDVGMHITNDLKEAQGPEDIRRHHAEWLELQRQQDEEFGAHEADLESQRVLGPKCNWLWEGF